MNNEPIQGTEWTDSNKTYWKWKWHLAKYGDPYSEFVLCILPIQSAHTQHWTHTPWTHTHTHTRSSGQPSMLRRRGVVVGSVPCSRTPRSWYWRWRKLCTFTPPPTQFLPDQDSNPWPLDYKSDSLPSGHNFPECPLIIWTELVICLFTWTGWMI